MAPIRPNFKLIVNPPDQAIETGLANLYT